tara:strand:- start:1412 stop:2137 length:726 start_codon:yes stop_codon:yes gene_type:complete
MVNVDTVYQRVLAIANKEQRGYITPLEFNLLANQAQKEIFGSYFVELNQALAMPGNESEYSDIVKTLNEKISIFKINYEVLTNVGGYFAEPSDMYKLGTVWYVATDLLVDGVEVQEVTPDEVLDYYQSPLTKPNKSRPLYMRREGIVGPNATFPVQQSIGPALQIISAESILSGIACSYTRKPSKVEWGYVVVDEQALYNAGSATNFELHTSEETTLVIKILGLAGVVIQKQDLMALGQQA